MFVALFVACVLNLNDSTAEAFGGQLQFVGIAAAIVIENTLGKVLQKSCLKILGTLSGGLAAWAVSRFTDIAVGFDDFVSKSAIFIICVPLVAAATVFRRDCIEGHSGGYVVFLLTWVSIMIGSWREDVFDEASIFWKTFNVLIGSCLATLCTFTIFPVRASQLLLQSFLESTDELVEFFSAVLSLYTDHVFGDGKCDDEEDDLVDGLQASTSEMMKNLANPRQYIDHAKEEYRFCHRTLGAGIDWKMLLEKRDEAGWTMIGLLSNLDSGTAQTSLCVKRKKDIRKIVNQFRACMYGLGGIAVECATTEQVAPHLGALAAQIALFACKAQDEESRGLPKQTLVELSNALLSIMCKVRFMFLACNPAGGPLLNSEFRKCFPRVPAGSPREVTVSAVMHAMGLSRLHMFGQDDEESDEVAADRSHPLSRRAAKRLLCVMNLAKFNSSGIKGQCTETAEERVNSTETIRTMQSQLDRPGLAHLWSSLAKEECTESVEERVNLSKGFSSTETVKPNGTQLDLPGLAHPGLPRNACTPRSFAGASGGLSMASTCCPSVVSQDAVGSRAAEYVGSIHDQPVLPPLPTSLSSSLMSSQPSHPVTTLPPPAFPPTAPPSSLLPLPSLSSSLNLPPSSGATIDENLDWKWMLAAICHTMRDDLKQRAETQERIEAERMIKEQLHTSEMKELRIQIEQMHSSNDQIMKWFEKMRKKAKAKQGDDNEIMQHQGLSPQPHNLPQTALH
eukprot:gnl/MRDRNA2_/MRDRNA2_130082_c0_seq1.p1 gnl/MRDRNA2_/MRDRNA2_130082_c0~~gnl/MRDRNA2_/MRDRNA2_130082_c0_seq1.p1  ORF type:complete len:761 (+),score=145.57 gnl/MRDRNA2_/MRDRNA2_130082_c0_seq1:77-2284(+)